MITLEMCLDYISSHRATHPEWLSYDVQLTKSQQKFLKNLCKGKITDTPKVFDRTFIIKLYCECWNYYKSLFERLSVTLDL